MNATTLENLLIVALDGVTPVELPPAEVLVVAPALNSWLRHWLSDDDSARRRAGELVAAWVDRFEQRGIHAEGRVGDADPLLAIGDALQMFPADEIVIAALSERSSRLADELVLRARGRFPVPVSRAGVTVPGGRRTTRNDGPAIATVAAATSS